MIRDKKYTSEEVESNPEIITLSENDEVRVINLRRYRTAESSEIVINGYDYTNAVLKS